MNLSIAREKCKRDGICVVTCPLGLIQIKAEGEFPSHVRGAEALCVQCGIVWLFVPRSALTGRPKARRLCPDPKGSHPRA